MKNKHFPETVTPLAGQVLWYTARVTPKGRKSLNSDSWQGKWSCPQVGPDPETPTGQPRMILPGGEAWYPHRSETPTGSPEDPPNPCYRDHSVTSYIRTAEHNRSSWERELDPLVTVLKSLDISRPAFGHQFIPAVLLTPHRNSLRTFEKALHGWAVP